MPTPPPPVPSTGPQQAAEPPNSALSRQDSDNQDTEQKTSLAEAQAGAAVPARSGRYQPWRTVETVRWADRESAGPFRVLRSKTFLLTVLIPTLLSGLYFGLVASDQYISESRFVVRTPQRQQQSTFVGALLQGTGFNRAQDDALSVHDYILSRDALKLLEDKYQVKREYSDPKLDYFGRFPGVIGDDSFESLFKYYLKHATIEYDANSSITTLKVKAFTPELAREINASLLGMGEQLVNTINERGRQDLIQYAQAEVSGAEAKAKAAALALATYRNARAVFDPERQSALQLQQVSKIQDELIATKIQVVQIQTLTPQNPQIPSLQRRVKSLEQEMASEMSKVAGGGPNSFADKATEFERLSLERTFADRQVASALASLENARNEARRKQLYLERIVQPNLPDYAVEPKRLRNVFATLVLGLIAWAVVSMLMAGVREHQD